MSGAPQFEHSPELDQIGAALAAAQGEFEAVPKTSTNPFFKSKFADLAAVVKAATPVLAKHGLSVSQLPGHDAGGDTLTTIVLHKSGQFLASTMRLRPVKDDPQSQGSATTYGRRYSFMAALNLVADEDDDGNAASAPARKAAPVNTLTQEAYEGIVLAFQQAGSPVAALAAHLAVEPTTKAITAYCHPSAGNLTDDQARDLILWLKDYSPQEQAA